MTSQGCCLFFFSPVFHPGGIILRVHQAWCSHDIYLMRSKALHKVPGTDMILWTNFIIVTPLTSGRFTNDEFGSSYSKWSLTSFILSFPSIPLLCYHLLLLFGYVYTTDCKQPWASSAHTPSWQKPCDCTGTKLEQIIPLEKDFFFSE